jgi:DNA invertase Pin-like site-specific DNA recombinase
MPRAQKTRGRKPDASSKSGKIRELLKTGMSANEIAKKIGCTTGLVYNVKARMGGAGKARRTAGRQLSSDTYFFELRRHPDLRGCRGAQGG